MGVASDRTFDIAAPLDRVWDALVRVADYPSWWPWLRDFDGRTLAAGAVWECTIRSPLGISIPCAIHIVAVEPSDRVEARLTGGLTGRAVLTCRAALDRTAVRLVSDLEPRMTGLRHLARLAPPVARLAHDRLITTAFDQFSRELARPGP